MKYINLKNDFQIDRAANKNVPSDQELTLNWLATGMGYGYNHGLTSDNRRLMVGIVKKVEVAKETKSDFLEVNTFEYEFMKKGFENAVCSAQEVLYVTIAEDALLAASDTVPLESTVQDTTVSPTTNNLAGSAPAA